MISLPRIKRPFLIAVGVAAALAGSITATAPPAQAATSAMTFGPTTVSGIPVSTDPPTQLVREFGTISVDMTAGQTAYVYSTMRARGASAVTMVDNEIRCAGAGAGNVVLGENIDPSSSTNPGRTDITIINRFLVSALTTGSLTCKIYLRTGSLSGSTSSVTVSGELRFASASVREDVNGLAMQTSLPYGNIPVTSRVYTPVLDRTLPAGNTKVAVIADMQYQSCTPGACPDSTDTSAARFTLYVQQMSGNTVCASATPAQTSVAVNRQTHHKAVPLYTTVTLKPGCDRLYAYVRTEYVSGPAGSIQGQSVGLSDATGVQGVDPKHNSSMTHIFAVPS